jgi:PST family polysaccharide transporter
MRGLTGSTLKGVFWMSLSAGVQALLQLLVLLILARILAPEDFGVVAAALIVVGFSLIFSQLGVGPALVQRAALEEKHIRTGFTLSLLFGVGLTGLIWMLAPAISLFFRIETLTSVVQVMSFVFLFQAVATVGEALLQRELRFRSLGIIEMLALGGFGVVGITLALLKLGVWALVAAHLVQALLKAALILRVEPHPKRLLLDRKAVRDLMVFGGGFTIARVGNYLSGQADNLVVGRFLGAEALGLYSRAYYLMSVPASLFGQVLDRVLFPAMAKVQHDKRRLGLAFKRGIAITALTILPLSVALLLLAPELIRVLLGPKWSEAIVPFQILVIGMLFRASYKLSDSLARATGAVYRRAWRQILFAILVAIGAYLGQKWGLAGVALGVMLAITVNFMLMAQLSLRLAELTWGSFWAVHMPALRLSLVLGIVIWIVADLLRDWGISPGIILLTTGASASVVGLILLRYLPREFVLGNEGVWIWETLADYIGIKSKLSLRTADVSNQ